MRSIHRLVLGGLAVLCLITGTASYGQEPKSNAPTARLDPKTGAIIVPLQGSVRLQMRNKKFIRSVYFDRDGVVQVLPDATKPDTVIVFGRGVGTVTLELTDTDGGKETYEVVVQQDIDLLRNLIKRAVPTANVEVLPGVGGLLILSGYVARAEDVDTVLRIAAAVGGSGGNTVNAMSVGGVQQVQLDVTVASVNRSKMRTRGVDFLVSGTSVNFGSILGGITSISSGNGVTGTLTAGPSDNQGNFVLGLLPTQVLTSIRALKDENLAKLLAEPKLVTQSGRPARFLSGGQQAVISSSSGISGPGVTYLPFGTELEFLPIVYGNGKIYLEVAPTIRAVNAANGVSLGGGATSPGFDENTIRTSVVMEPGQTFAIGGLIQNSVQSTSRKVPILGEIPFIGALFSRSSYTETETELIILVTPHLVDAMDCNQVPKRLPGRETRSPDDFEFYLETMLELPRGQRNVFEGRRYKAAWKNDPTAEMFPCGINGGANYTTGPTGVSNCANGSCQAPAPTISGPNGGGRPPAPTILPAPTIPMGTIPDTIKPLSGTFDPTSMSKSELRSNQNLPPLPRLQ